MIVLRLRLASFKERELQKESEKPLKDQESVKNKINHH